MAKGAIITEQVRKLVAEVYHEHPDWRAKEIQYQVDSLLRGKGPGLSAIQKMLTQFRARWSELDKNDSRDRPWHMGTLIEHDLPAEALPFILAVQEFRRQKTYKPLTIREAWWIAHLRTIITNTEVLEVPEVLSFWALIYAHQEWLHKVIGITLDTAFHDDVKIWVQAEGFAAYQALSNTIEEQYGIDKAVKVLDYILKIRSEAQKRELRKHEVDVLETVDRLNKEAIEWVGCKNALVALYSDGTYDDMEWPDLIDLFDQIEGGTK